MVDQSGIGTRGHNIGHVPWVDPKSCKDSECPPDCLFTFWRYGSGFEDRTSGRGCVVRGWAPQVEIVNHRAVGVLFTHCGWNSILESISAGVPMLACPMTADQFVDATLLVELGVANMVCQGAEEVPGSIELGENRVERVRAVKLHEVSLNAMKEGGSS